MNKKTIGWIIALLVVGIASFSIGTAYGKGQNPSGIAGGQGQPANGSSNGGRFGGRMAGGGFTAGQILSADSTGITVKLPDGSTRIVLIGPDAEILKADTGSPADLSSGKNVLVTGTANPDGSITAKTIQIRAAGMGQPSSKNSSPAGQ